MHAECQFCLLYASACIIRGEMLPIILSLYVGQLYVSPASVKLLALVWRSRPLIRHYIL